jgi:hypothetical protein
VNGPIATVELATADVVKPAVRVGSTAVLARSRRRAARQRKRRWLLGLAAGLVFVGGIVSAIIAWSIVRDAYVPKRFGPVIPGELYRSGQISRYLIEDVLTQHHIGTVIDLNGWEPTNADQQVEVAVTQYHGGKHVRFPLRGNGMGHLDRFAGAIETIVESQRRKVPVLVHCAAGTQRTGSCVAFYRLLVRGDAPGEVYRDLVAYGWDPRHDTDMLEFVNANMKPLAEILVARKVIARLPAEMPRLAPE